MSWSSMFRFAHPVASSLTVIKDHLKKIDVLAVLHVILYPISLTCVPAVGLMLSISK